MMAAKHASNFRGVLLRNEPMANHTSWRVGGPARNFYKPADLADLVDFLRAQPRSEHIEFVGLGSNLLVRDGGIRGTVVCTSGVLNVMTLEADGRVRAEAGVACNKVARFCARHGLVGAEFLAGIPGTMGGALAMNAGAFGGETWNIVDAAQTIDHGGRLHERPTHEFKIGYRHVVRPANEWFTAAYLRLEHGDAAESEKRIKELLAQRNATQPTQTANAGSTFRNPPGDHAARLIEAAGLKGFCIGGACVSDKHANFIVNGGDASAADIEALIEHIGQTVLHAHGVELVREVHIVGEAQP
jgi:UDP-N-acetylmuramate dehydrogenase